MVILQQDLPLLKRLAVTVARPSPSIDDRSALLAFAIGVGAGIERVLEYRDHVAVADRRPVEGDQLLAVGRPRKVNALREHRQQDLACTAELAEADEDQPDHFLDPPVRIKAEADLAMPDVADRHADTQLAASRLGTGGIEHTRPQHAELELADAALHTEQQPIVRPAGVVDPVHIDHPRLDQPAKLEQVMPIATVAGEPRGIEAQHGTNLAGAQPRDEPFEAWSRRRTAGGTAEIVVDHFDVAETPLPGDFDEIVLPPLAFEVVVNLCRGGLTNINHRLALQHGGRQQISARHCQAPRWSCRRPPTAGWPTCRARFGALRESSREALSYRTGC